MSRRLNIGVITRNEQDSYYGVLLDSIHRKLCQENCIMFVINTYMIYSFNQEPDRDSIYYSLAMNHIDGWIVLSDGASVQYIKALAKSGKPVVLISSEHSVPGCLNIYENSQYGAEVVTQHLINHGHKRILFIGWFKIFDMVKRFEGYKDTLLKNGIDFDENLVLRTSGSLYSDVMESVKNAIDSGISFTAIFAANDQHAIGAIEALKRSGLRVPEDIAVIGYDNSFHAANYSPGITSMGQNVRDKGIAAVESILRMLKGEDLSGNNIVINSDLFIRSSCGCSFEANYDDQVTLENLRSKDLIIDSLEKSYEKYSFLGSQLLTNNINDIKKVLPDIVGNYSWKCTGFWEDTNDDSGFYINKIFDSNLQNELSLNVKCPIEDFPPKEFMSDLNKLDVENIVWIRLISSACVNLGIVAHIFPINNVSTQFTFDNNIVLFNLIGTAIEHELSNSELKKTLETLRQTQEQLINSEKMVSLGGLVTGVAHEINTPIGVSVTAASYLNERSEELMELFQDGKLKRSDLQGYLETSLETIKILSLNLKRASDLICSFKQIAVDQFVEEKRIFNVREYINEVLLSLNPKLKKTMITVSVDCPDDLEMYSHPGALSQIITNLIVNSLMHAYKHGDTGKININIYLEDKMVNLIFSDDGSGIKQENLGKVFDPFFTTKRGSGGTGLGLNVVYNIVTQEYGGSIKCTSEPGMGTIFTIKFPLKEV